jgi:hypothetical protein
MRKAEVLLLEDHEIVSALTTSPRSFPHRYSQVTYHDTYYEVVVMRDAYLARRQSSAKPYKDNIQHQQNCTSYAFPYQAG